MRRSDNPSSGLCCFRNGCGFGRAVEGMCPRRGLEAVPVDSGAVSAAGNWLWKGVAGARPSPAALWGSSLSMEGGLSSEGIGGPVLPCA